MSAARVYSPTLATPAVHKAHGSDTSTAVLTYPVIDAEGEWIQPDGGDWSKYPLNPKVDWHHGEPIGRGEVTLKAVSIRGKNWVVPVGTTQFANSESDFDNLDLRILGRDGRPTNKSYSRSECLHVAQQAKQLVLADIATGVSIELDPLERRPLGKSLLKGGTAFAYPRWVGLGWAHTLAGGQVNPGAQTVAKALEIARSGKLPGGEAMLPVIRKAFDPLLTDGISTTIRVNGTPPTRKAMDYEPTEPVADEMPTEAAPESDTPDEASVPTEIAQLLSDAADRLEDIAAKTLHKPSNKYLAKYAEEARALAEDLIAHADSIGDELASRGKGDADDKPDEGEEDETDDEKDKEEDVEKAWPRIAPRPLKDSMHATGRLVCKSFNYVARLTMKDLKPVEKIAEEETPPPSFDLHGLNRRLSRLARTTRN